MREVKTIERGWAGHFICALNCRFRRNTLVTDGKTRIIVSSVGLMEHKVGSGDFEQIGCDRYYETMAFHSDSADTRYYDADVSREVSFDSPWRIDTIDADDKMNEQHDVVVQEIKARIMKGEFDVAIRTLVEAAKILTNFDNTSAYFRKQGDWDRVKTRIRELEKVLKSLEYK